MNYFVAVLSLVCGLLWQSTISEAAQPSAVVYHASIEMAAKGELNNAILSLQAASAVLPEGDIWRERMVGALALLQMRKNQEVTTGWFPRNMYAMLSFGYIRDNPIPANAKSASAWITGLLAAVFPGAGHAWLGRWHDAGVAAFMVWPLFLLTLWSIKRGSPCSIGLVIVSLWLWSGTIFSAVSLTHRINTDVYMQWWKLIWKASALLGQPW